MILLQVFFFPARIFYFIQSLFGSLELDFLLNLNWLLLVMGKSKRKCMNSDFEWKPRGLGLEKTEGENCQQSRVFSIFFSSSKQNPSYLHLVCEEPNVIFSSALISFFFFF